MEAHTCDDLLFWVPQYVELMFLPQSLSHGSSRVALQLWLWRNDLQGGHSSTQDLRSTVHLRFISENSHINVISLSSSHHLLMCFCRKVKATGVAFDDADEDWSITLFLLHILTAALPTMNFLLIHQFMKRVSLLVEPRISVTMKSFYVFKFFNICEAGLFQFWKLPEE